jgi:hypothetical protein
MLHRRSIAAVMGATLLAAGCSKPAELIVGAVPATGPAPAVIRTGVYDASPTEIYVRIARGANACWFGRDGPLKATHILFADAEPPDRGGGAEITIFERDPTVAPENQRARRALKVNIVHDGGRSRVETQPLKLSPDLAAQLPQDVQRWAGGDSTCATAPPVPAYGATAKLKEEERVRK